MLNNIGRASNSTSFTAVDAKTSLNEGRNHLGARSVHYVRRNYLSDQKVATLVHTPIMAFVISQDKICRFALYLLTRFVR
jgi:hypothetical protein